MKVGKNLVLIIVILIISGIIFAFEFQKVGFHEDEVYTISSSVNPINGLMTAYKDNAFCPDESPVWKTKEEVKEYMTLTKDNYLNMKSIYINQAIDNHPPIFYILVHFSAILFSGQFTKYSVFLVNIIAFILSCFVIKKILELMGKENIILGTIIFYGLSMGTISMVIFQRMYMLLTLFVLLYFYYNLKIYKNNFNLDSKILTRLGIITICGFLVQYFFAIYAFIIFLIMTIKMLKDKKLPIIKKYVVSHIIYALIGVLIFVPCLHHLFFTDRGIKNLENTNYFSHFWQYIQHLAYSFSINNNFMLIIFIFSLFFAGIIYAYKKTDKKFILVLTTIPSIFYFIVAVKLTSYQELRYIMPVIPFVALTLFIILDNIIKVKYKNIIVSGIAIILVIVGMIFSRPKFLYTDYEKFLEIAKQNSDKSFVYVYDNSFCHIQSIPEMMIYNKTFIINTSRDETRYISSNEELNKEDSYILSIKSYMNNEEILEYIKNNTDFKNIKKIYSSEDSQNVEEPKILNELYLVEK